MSSAQAARARAKNMKKLTLIIYFLLAGTVLAKGTVPGADYVKDSLTIQQQVERWFEEEGTWLEVNRSISDHLLRLSKWYVQGGLDMSLQKPYGYDFSKVMPNGRSFGVNMAVGRWFTTEIGLRARTNWENGIKMFENPKLNWLAPFNMPGENMKRGGYLSVTGDIMFDARNIFIGGQESDVWHIQPFLRAGGVYNYGTDKGAPLIGAGISNQIRLNKNLSLYVDAAYNGVSSGFTMDPSTATGVGSGSNMFFDIDLGVTYRLGYFNAYTAMLTISPDDYYVIWDGRASARRGGSFWKGWFIQLGPDLTRYNLCEKDFSESWSKGRTMGVNAALGRWFSPSIGLRGRLNWENGIGLLENKDLEWIPYDAAKHTSNMDGGGCMLMTADVLFSLRALFFRAYHNMKFDYYSLARMGLSHNCSIGSLSPLVGIGGGAIYRTSDRIGLFVESTYQGTTSEYFSGVSWSGPTGSTFNGIWDISTGIQINL